MSDRESRISQETIVEEESSPGMKAIPRDMHTEEIFLQGEERGIRRGQLRALRSVLWKYLNHRFQFVPSPVYNYIDWVSDPERLMDAFEHALTIEKIEDLRI
jgi:hypothetical protein